MESIPREQGNPLLNVSDAQTPPPTGRIGPYEIVASIGRGGTAEVFEVLDPRTPGLDHLAVKVLPAGHLPDEEARSRFRREFRALSRLDHPNVLRVHDWGLDGERPWFSMELVPGSDLKELATALVDEPVDQRFAKVRSYVIEVARALAYIHERGLVHRDVTPRNVRVRPDGSVKLMDFGVARDQVGDHSNSGEIVGTAAWMAPEQIAGRSVDARADLYGLGCVMYLLLTGRRPFSAHTVHGWYEQHLRATVRAPREVDARVPPDLDEACRRLLEKEPAARFASANHLLRVLGDVSAVQTPGSPLVGRSAQIAVLRDGIDEMVGSARSSAYVLTGPSGSGTTRLLAYAAQIARSHGLLVLKATCRANDRPFGAFAALGQQLTAHRGRANEVLDAAFGSAPRETLERWPVMAAFRDELAAVPNGVVVVVDDIEFADAAETELLVFLLRSTLEQRPVRIVWVLGVEAGSAHEAAAARVRGAVLSVPSVRVVELPALQPADVEEWMVGLVGSSGATRALAARLHVETEGSPAAVADMLGALIDEGVLIPRDDLYALTLDAGEIARSRLPLPANLLSALRERLAPLPTSGWRIGRIVALGRRKMSLDVVQAVAGVHDDDLIEGLDALVDLGVVSERRVGEIEFVELGHTRYRRPLLEGIDPEELRGMHRQLAEALERAHRRDPGEIVEDLAYYFEAAGIATKAYAMTVLTANRHLARSLYEESLGFLDDALRLEPAARPWLLIDEADRRLAEVHLARCQALFQLGQPTLALADAGEADGLARRVGDARLESRVATELGTILRSLGADLVGAERELNRAIDRAEAAGDLTLLPGPRYQLGALRWSRHDLDGAERAWREALSIADRLSDARAQGHGWNGLGILALCRGQSGVAREMLERSAAVFERLGMLGPLAVARVNLIELYANTGSLKMALELADRTAQEATEAHNQQALAMALGYRALVRATVGAGEEACRDAREAVSVALAMGALEDEGFARAALVAALLAANDAAGAEVELSILYPLLETHDPEGIAPLVLAWRAWVAARAGRRAEARALLDDGTARSLWPHVQIRADLARGRAEWALRESGAAVAAWRRALDAAEATSLRTFQLEAHHELSRSDLDESSRARHRRVAVGLARALAGSLSGEDSRTFLARGWGD